MRRNLIQNLLLSFLVSISVSVFNLFPAQAQQRQKSAVPVISGTTPAARGLTNVLSDGIRLHLPTDDSNQALDQGVRGAVAEDLADEVADVKDLLQRSRDRLKQRPRAGVRASAQLSEEARAKIEQEIAALLAKRKELAQEAKRARSGNSGPAGENLQQGQFNLDSTAAEIAQVARVTGSYTAADGDRFPATFLRDADGNSWVAIVATKPGNGKDPLVKLDTQESKALGLKLSNAGGEFQVAVWRDVSDPLTELKQGPDWYSRQLADGAVASLLGLDTEIANAVGGNTLPASVVLAVAMTEGGVERAPPSGLTRTAMLPSTTTASSSASTASTTITPTAVATGTVTGLPTIPTAVATGTATSLPTIPTAVATGTATSLPTIPTAVPTGTATGLPTVPTAVATGTATGLPATPTAVATGTATSSIRKKCNSSNVCLRAARGAGPPYCNTTRDCEKTCHPTTPGLCSVRNGGTRVCNSSQDCKTCHPTVPRLCSLRNGGTIPCRSRNDCNKQCNGVRQCVPGGILGRPCSNNGECTKKCNGSSCSFGGTGTFTCNVTADCQKKCNNATPSLCVLGGTSGVNCSVNTNCERRCSSDSATCVLGATDGVPCTTANEASICQKRCGGFDFKQCVFGGSGGLCTLDRQCLHMGCDGSGGCALINSGGVVNAPDVCTANSQCIADACEFGVCKKGRILSFDVPKPSKCTNDEQCFHTTCSPNAECRKTFPISSVDADPEPDYCSLSDPRGSCRRRVCEDPIVAPPICTTVPFNGESAPNHECSIVGDACTPRVRTSRASVATLVPELAKKARVSSEGPPSSYKRVALSYHNVGSSLGSPSAAIKIEMYQDLRCGMCTYAFNEVIPQIISEYVNAGIAKLEFKEYPLIQAEAEMILAQAAQCAGDQGKYYDYLTRIYSIGHDDKVDISLVNKIAKEEGLEVKDFESCLASKKHLATVERDIKQGRDLKIDGTPTFYINGTPVLGAQPVEEFRKVIEQERAKLNFN